MQYLEQLVASGFSRNGDSSQGNDRTVSALDWALANVEGGGRTASTYAEQAGRELEARLFAAYVVQALAFLKNGNQRLAVQTYEKARMLVNVTHVTPGCPGAMCDQIAATLSQLAALVQAEATPGAPDAAL